MYKFIHKLIKKRAQDPITEEEISQIRDILKHEEDAIRILKEVLAILRHIDAEYKQGNRSLPHDFDETKIEIQHKLRTLKNFWDENHEEFQRLLHTETEREAIEGFSPQEEAFLQRWSNHLNDKFRAALHAFMVNQGKKERQKIIYTVADMCASILEKAHYDTDNKVYRGFKIEITHLLATKNLKIEIFEPTKYSEGYMIDLGLTPNPHGRKVKTLSAPGIMEGGFLKVPAKVRLE